MERSNSYIEVVGEASKEVVPDEIFVAFAINEKDSKNRKSMAQQESELVEMLKNNNIDLAALTTVDIDGTLDNSWIFKKDVFTIKNFYLKLSNVSIVTKVFGGLKEIGITNFRIASTNYSKEEELINELRGTAVLTAKNNAIALARPLNQEIGRATFISENGISRGENRMDLYNLQRMKNSDDYNEYKSKNLTPLESPNIEFKKIRIACKAFVRFELL